MIIIFSLLFTFCLLTLSVYKGIFVAYPLLVGFFIFSYIAWKKGFKPMDIIKMSYNGGKKAFVVLKIFILIGAITGIWMASGTVPGIIYYGIKYMNPNFFILYTFIISSTVSFLLGTSLGTVSTVGIALIMQKYKMTEILKYILLGFNLKSVSPLQGILKGGGIISMLKASLVVFISCSLAGIFEGTNMLKNIENVLMKAKTRYKLFIYTIIVSIFTGAFGSNQSIAVVLTTQLMKKSYEDKNIDKYELAIDLENTAIVLSALIPWNIAAFVPTTTMEVSRIGFIPYAFYLYLIPICNIIFLKILEKNKVNLSNNYPV